MNIIVDQSHPNAADLVNLLQILDLDAYKPLFTSRFPCNVTVIDSDAVVSPILAMPPDEDFKIVRFVGTSLSPWSFEVWHAGTDARYHMDFHVALNVLIDLQEKIEDAFSAAYGRSMYVAKQPKRVSLKGPGVRPLPQVSDSPIELDDSLVERLFYSQNEGIF